MDGRSRNSALYWYPRIKGVKGASPPRTVIVRLEPGDALILCSNQAEFRRNRGEEIDRALARFAFPVFLKTDELAAKHDWKETCFLERREDFYPHLRNLVYMSRMVDEKVRAVLIREFLELEAPLTFFRGEMPVARERRYFVRGAEVVCHHPYWNKSVFRDEFERDDRITERLSGPELKRRRLYPKRLRERILEEVGKLNEETEEEVSFLTGVAERAGMALGGEWSIDFARDREGVWHLIDCALAKDSWHPEGCPRRSYWEGGGSPPRSAAI
jgi:hypothetical protein